MHTLIRLVENPVKKRVVVYLDLLGSKSSIKEDIEGAIGRQSDFTEVRRVVRMLERIQPPSMLPEGQLKRLAKRNALDSFSHLLPMSDSVFIVSDQPDMVAEQLSTLLSKCFQYDTADFELSKDIQHVSTGKPMSSSGTAEKDKCKKNCYPILFRGGISYGGVKVVEDQAISGGHDVSIPNVIGPGVVQAVDLEQMRLPGPRILCDREFVDQLKGVAANYLRREGDSWELLWPAFCYVEGDDERAQSYVLNDLFDSAFALWQCYRGTPFEKHYSSFLELIVRSHLAFAESASDPELVNEFLNQKLDEFGLRLYNSVKNSQLVFPNKKGSERATVKVIP